MYAKSKLNVYENTEVFFLSGFLAQMFLSRFLARLPSVRNIAYGRDWNTHITNSTIKTIMMFNIATSTVDSR